VAHEVVRGGVRNYVERFIETLKDRARSFDKYFPCSLRCDLSTSCIGVALSCSTTTGSGRTCREAVDRPSIGTEARDGRGSERR